VGGEVHLREHTTTGMAPESHAAESSRSIRRRLGDSAIG
jgi:hypothetical protein